MAISRRSVTLSAGADSPRALPSDYRRSTVGLGVLAVAAPLWDASLGRLPVGTLTVGRAGLMLAVVLFAVDVLLAPPTPNLDVGRTARRLLAAAYVLFGLWATTSTFTGGCGCGALLGAYAEIAITGLVALLLLARSPRSGPALLAACLLGALVATVAAAAGVHPVGAGAVDGTAGRLSGTYGNANQLGYALALVIPIGVAAVRLSALNLAIRIVSALSLLLVSVALAATFSRGALIAAAVGGLGVLMWTASSRRSRWSISVAAALFALGTATAYPIFLESRISASFETGGPALPSADRSGWDPAAPGLPARPSSLSNVGTGSALQVSTDRPGEGVSHPVGDSRAGASYTIVFQARSARERMPFAFGLKAAGEDSSTVQTVVLDRKWKRLEIGWTASSGHHTRVYFWQVAGLADFSLRQVERLHRWGPFIRQRQPISTHLRGSPGPRATLGQLQEQRYLRSRAEGAGLAIDAFRANPVWGIGWDTFTRYSDARLKFGPLATHNEYLRVAAELGGIGVLIVLLGGVALVGSLRAVRQDDLTAIAAAGVLGAGVINQLFVNGIVFYDASVPLVFAAAILANLRKPSTAGGRRGIPP